jgi:surfeit locus 1 family protein
MRIRLSPLPVMTVFTVFAFAALIALGGWQWSRYQEKRLIAAASVDEMALSPFTPVNNAVHLVYAARDGAPGWRVFTPVHYGDQVVFADVAHVPGAAAPDWRVIEPPSALAAARAVTGVAVTPRPPSAFAAKGNAETHVWYQVDLPAMAAASGLTGVAPYYVAMPYVDAAGHAEANPFAGVGARDPLPPERHLGYAVTWWGLAAALVGVYLAFHARAGRFVVTR